MSRFTPRRAPRPSLVQAVADVRDFWHDIENATDRDVLSLACWNWWWARQRLRDAIIESPS